jgi:hypothetical protein
MRMMRAIRRCFHLAHPSNHVDKGDIISILAALIIVSMLAVMLNPLAVRDDTQSSEPADPPHTPTVITAPTDTPASSGESYRIRYETRIQKYPYPYLPGNLSSFGGSDPLWKTQEVIEFAYIEEASGGITKPFSVPYPVWRLNCTVIADKKPAGAQFRMALFDAETQNLIEGAELRFPGSIVKNVQVGYKEFYLIVGVVDVDMYRITLETLPRYL